MSARRRLTFVILLGSLLTFALGASSAFGALELVDAYSESNISATWSVSATQPRVGQSFTATRGTLDSVTLYVGRATTAVGTTRALLYAHSGTFGLDGVPTGAPLAASAPVDVTTFGSGGELVNFRFDNTVLLTEGAKYFIVLECTNAPSDPVISYYDSSSPTHSGNFAAYGAGGWASYASYDLAFFLYETPPALVPVYRFYNRTNGTHFYTDSAAERDTVNATWPHIYTDEGPTYYTYPANNSTQLTRLYNKVSGSHFYTASSTEAANALATWPGVFQLDGATYKVNPAPVANSLPVYRFFNRTNGSHFYTASETEKAHVMATWPHIYTLEGPAFWLGQ